MTTTQQPFNADVAQLIQLVTHSIYSNKDVFLRELLSNASDAIQKAKIFSAQDSKYLGTEQELHIIVDIDKENNIIIIEDTGVGMSREDVIENIGTIAKSGTKSFLAGLKEAKEAQQSDLIGQFGIGFYSAFMVAKRVEIETKKVGEDAVLRSSDGQGTYEINDSDKATRGTVIRLHIHDESTDYVDANRLQGLIRKHSNYVPVPISMYSYEDEKKTDILEQINAMKSIWTKQKSEVTKEEYQSFYSALSFDQSEPLDTIHLHIEGMVNFRALLYIPKNPPLFGPIDAEQDYGPTLYVQNVMIMERTKELLPVWLRFVKGVVETPDLSLNVSRELIQSSTILNKIQKTLVKEVLKSLTYLVKNDREIYGEFYKNYSRYIKEGVHYDFERKEDIAGTLLYHSLKQGSLVRLDEYVDAFEDTDTQENKEDNKEEKKDENKEQSPIYYLIGQSLTQLQSSPYLEQFDGTDHDVLLMDDPIDERVMQSLQSYNNHKFVSAMHAEISVDAEDQEQDTETSNNKDTEVFLGFAKDIINNETLESVTLSTRLKNSVSILVRKEGENTAQMERIMKSMGQEVPAGKKTLQLNSTHPLVEKMIALHATDPASDELKQLMLYTYEQAVLLEGGMVENMNEFLKRVNTLLS